MSPLRDVRVQTQSDHAFYSTIRGNFADYFFFHVDYAQYPENTEIYMALDEADTVLAMLLIWKNRRIQVRGTNFGVEYLLEKHHPPVLTVTGYEEHRPLIEKFYPDYTLHSSMYRMGLKRQDFKPVSQYPFQQLSESHRNEITSLMRIADPIFWAKNKAEDLLMDEYNTYYAIIEADRLLSLTGLWEYENIGYIPLVATHIEYCNRGMASSLLSSVLSKAFQTKKEAFIMVRTANAPAVHTYSKIGFKICNTQYMYEKPSKV